MLGGRRAVLRTEPHIQPIRGLQSTAYTVEESLLHQLPLPWASGWEQKSVVNHLLGSCQEQTHLFYTPQPCFFRTFQVSPEKVMQHLQWVYLQGYGELEDSLTDGALKSCSLG